VASGSHLRMGEVVGLSRRKLLNIIMREIVSFFPGARNVFGHIDSMRAWMHVLSFESVGI
jgi:hypothetical protein